MNQNPSHYPPVHLPDQPIHQLPPDRLTTRFYTENHHDKNTMNQELNAASEEKDNLVKDLRSLLSATSNMVEENVAEARKRITAALDSGGKLVESIQGKAVEGAKYTDKVVHNHPYQAAAIALGVGVLIGHLLTPQQSSSKGWF